MSFLKFLGPRETHEDDPVTNLPISKKFTTSYIDPVTGERNRISVSYEYNKQFADAFENQLLRSPVYEDFVYKANVLNEFINKEIKSYSFTMSPTVTALKFVTATADGKFQWESYEDPESMLNFVPAIQVPQHIPRINFQHLSEITEMPVAVNAAFTARFLGVKFFIKAHVDHLQEFAFPRELESRIKIGDVPHICPLLGIVVQDSPIDGKSYVQGMLLEYAEQGTLLQVLRYSDPPIKPVIKELWAAQIAHGLAGIHRAGVTHGDLKSENIVVDDNDDILIIDIGDGISFSPGWRAKLDSFKDPRRDVYSLGVTIWELIHDGEELPCIGCALPIDRRGQNHHESFVSLIDDCHVEFADKRLSLSAVIDRLGGSDKCGCRVISN
jgi:hypothetical protein